MFIIPEPMLIVYLVSFAWMIADGMNYLATMKVHHVSGRINDVVTVITVSFQ